MKLSKIRGVLFDLDGTLYDLKALKLRLIKRIPSELSSFGPLGAFRRLKALQSFRKAREAHRGTVFTKSLREHLVSKVAKQIGYAREFVDRTVGDFLYESRFLELRSLMNPLDFAVLSELAHRGYRLGVVSEYPVVKKLVALGLGNIPWRAQVDCEQVGTLKPQPEVFLRGALELGLRPDQVMLVGDRLDADITGAAQIGMPSAWLKVRDPGYGGKASPDFVIQSLADLLGILPRKPAVR